MIELEIFSLLPGDNIRDLGQSKKKTSFLLEKSILSLQDKSMKQGIIINIIDLNIKVINTIKLS